VEILARRVTCRPGERALGICQDRLQEKAFLEGIGVPVAPWRAVRTEAELDAAVAELGLPAVLKTTRLGYDGRGQAVLRHPDDLASAWARLAPRPLILEGFVPFTLELSAIAARGADGALAVFAATENAHRHHILDRRRAWRLRLLRRRGIMSRQWHAGLIWSGWWHWRCSCCPMAG